MLLEFLFHAKPENHPKNFSVISNQKLYTFYRMYLMPNFSHLRKHHVPTFSAKLQRLFAEKDMIAFWDLILGFIFFPSHLKPLRLT